MLILLTQVAVTVDPTQRTIRTSAAGREIRRHAPRCAVGKAAAATPTEAKGVKSAEDRHRSDEDQLRSSSRGWWSRPSAPWSRRRAIRPPGADDCRLRSQRWGESIYRKSGPPVDYGGDATTPAGARSGADPGSRGRHRRRHEGVRRSSHEDSQAY